MFFWVIDTIEHSNHIVLLLHLKSARIFIGVNPWDIYR